MQFEQTNKQNTMMTFIFIIAVGIICYGLIRFVLSVFIGVPMVLTEKINDYKNGLLSSKEIKQWKVAIILWIILIFFFTLIYFVVKK
jgi:Ni,Fe-hydrogenase I cytochrome b subunit